MEMTDYELALAHQPMLYRDLREPFRVRRLGYTVFHQAAPSDSFDGKLIDPAEYGAAYVIEYAVYYDFDIQHLYDLEHVWVAVDAQEEVCACLSSFHGMRLCASGLPGVFRAEGGRPVLYTQPGKHALLPSPELFGLHPQSRSCCREKAGGGLLIKEMFAGRLHTTPEQDGRITRYIRKHFSFDPAWEFVREEVAPEQMIPWEKLAAEIPELVEDALQLMRKEWEAERREEK